MKDLIKIFVIVFILVLLVPLLWCLIKEILWFGANLLGGVAINIGSDGLGYLAFIVICLVLIIFFLKIIFD